MEKLIVSMMRFSTAITLFGLEQLEKVVNVGTGEDMSDAMDRLGSVLDSLTDTVSKELTHSKQAALQSVTHMSEEAVHRVVNGKIVVDPREVLRGTSDLTKKTADSLADLIAKGAEVVRESLEESEAAKGETKHKAKHEAKHDKVA